MSGLNRTGRRGAGSARTGRRRTDRTDEQAWTAGERRLSLRTALLVLLLVPSVALVALWGLGTYHLGDEYREQAAQYDLTAAVTQPNAALFNALERERRLTGEALASPRAARTALDRQRTVTDRAVRAFRPLASLDTGNGQRGLADALARAVRVTDRLAQERRAVDAGTVGQDRAFAYYTEAVGASTDVFATLSHGANGEVADLSQVLFDLNGVVDMISREDAVLAHGWASGRLSADDYDLVTDAVGTQEYLLDSRVAPNLTPAESRLYAAMTKSKEWRSRVALEERLQAADAGPDGVALPRARTEWRTAADASVNRLERLINVRSGVSDAAGATEVRQLRLFLYSAAALGLLAIVLVVLVTWRLTVRLRRRVMAVRDQAQDLGQRLPRVVARLEQGEDVDVEVEVPVLAPASDEFGELSRALNLASRSAVRTAVRQAEQHRGFERLLQRIARRTQLLIGLQLKKLDELERRHEDPQVLEGLFDLDHLTARLRRYEENLVILGGGQPRRRWRKPVPLLDVLRAAQGEVQDYRRIAIDVEGRPWISERAVGPLIHILAELMENATAFSKPPAPVEIKAAPVSRGIAVEIEDRGLGMEAEQYEAANALMQAPPQLDVMTRADDARLGLYVVARLSASLGLQVELRPSAFGGTRVIVLVPQALVAERPRSVPDAADGPSPDDAGTPLPAPRRSADSRPADGSRRPDGPDDLPVRSRGQAMADVTAPAPAPANPRTGPAPLPRRTRQASLAAELRAPDAQDAPAPQAPPGAPTRSGATIGAFQRQSRKNRAADARPSTPSTDQSEPLTTEDRG
ncbi:nitrate- and nitrite sensing domain-containing protein [Streptomyces sp. TG1A-8]|uniref:sensor histidine kinase n=1 Tax=Streptomyces sp. TG1A-8 TaxID=3051385 RepID=UPI00265BA3DC|nr:nitrate- and nitrite sensing domain-containing protein [Streptomyces sp. TG1A-8]MDO0924221.1 nitrate- and nitrite sensing domain-containing protein [Streptomyces sp. TG1A-8]